VYRAVLLDVYGTLVHEDDAVLGPICEHIAALAQVRTPVVAELWWRLFRQANEESHGETFRLQADLSRETLAATVRKLGVAADADQLCQAQFEFWRRPPIFSDSLPFLHRVGVPVCLVSNIDRDDLHAAMAHHDVEVAAVVTSQDARAYKPRPEPFELAVKALGMTTSHVLHVGDSLTADVAGAEALGIESAWINRSGRPLPAGPTPTHTANELTELLPMLQG
jgi:2-haloalkanoic acid dehalogenase type II